MKLTQKEIDIFGEQLALAYTTGLLHGREGAHLQMIISPWTAGRNYATKIIVDLLDEVSNDGN